MALKSSYLAADNSAERRSRALHRFIVASPVLLLLAVGLVGHLRHQPYASPAGTTDYDRRVLAYRDRVTAAEALPVGKVPPIRPYLKEAGRWIAGFDSGSLTALTPAVYEDHLRDGVRGEVFRSGMSVASGLALAAQRRLQSGRPAEAAPAALAAARLANGLRGFELQACLQGLLVQRRSLDILAHAWPSLSASDQRIMRETLLGLRVDPKEIDRLAAREEDQLQDYFRRQRLSSRQTRFGTFQFGDLAVVAIRRSVRLSNDRVNSLLRDRKTPMATKGVS